MMRWLIAAGVLACTASPLWAQLGPSLVLNPWSEKDHLYFESTDAPYFFDAGHTKDTDRSTHILTYLSEGRARFDNTGTQADFVVGYHINMLETDLPDPVISNSFTDIAFVAGGQLGQLTPDWTLSVVGGVGLATDTHFDNARALYGIASLNARWTISDWETLDVGLSYNGNRTYLPDVPLPYVTYTNQVTPDFAFFVGFPTIGIQWRPLEQVTVALSYFAPATFDFETAYHFDEYLSTYVGYHDTADAYRLDVANTRLFYQWRRLEVGLRAVIMPQFDLSFGGGWGFDQELSTGYDLLGDNTYEKLSNEPFFFICLRGGF